MTILRMLILTIATALLLCSFGAAPLRRPLHALSIADSLMLENYKLEIEKIYVDNAASMSREALDSLFFDDKTNFPASGVVYAPDSTFKIFTIELESCGAYCNSEWYSWIHFNLKGIEKTKKVEFTEVENIYLLPDYKYLIIEKSTARPASVLTVVCQRAQLLSFAGDSIIMHPIYYHHQDHFEYCQENSVQSEKMPFMKYDQDSGLLMYSYGNNYTYSQGIDTDTLREGQFKYIQGQFILDHEMVTVREAKD